ncbi:hypothetical protein GHT09_008411 [Marmota monax]|uniref:KASH5-like coiled-coil domain-containing protein n=1 Tax=Marmota monax TaxID=9995 RepID=A0A834V3N9_MARMO|nr:hypothetical protein GHT09_008411 [Marmota monax]
MDRLLPWQRQLYEYERLICQRDAILSERTRHTESLAKTLEEYRMTTQELRLEISHLEEQLNQTSEGPEELLEEAQARRAGWTTLVPTSLGLEIEAICQKQEMAGSDLSSPLCGVWQWEEVINEPQEETEFSSEILAGAQSNPEGETAHLEEGTKAPLLRLPLQQLMRLPAMASNWTCLGRAEIGRARGSGAVTSTCVIRNREKKGLSIGAGAGVLMPSAFPESGSCVTTDWEAGTSLRTPFGVQHPVVKEPHTLAPSLLTTDTPIPLGDPHPENIPGSPPESSSVESEFQQALVPVVKELVPVRRPWGQCCLHPQRLRVTQHPLVPAPILGLLLLLLLLSVLLLGQSQPPTWPHLQLCYLQPPPV